MDCFGRNERLMKHEYSSMVKNNAIIEGKSAIDRYIGKIMDEILLYIKLRGK